MLATIRLLARAPVALGFARALFPGFRHLEQRLAVVGVHAPGDADAVRRIFPVGFCVLHVPLLSHRANAEHWHLVRRHDGYASGTNRTAGRYRRIVAGPRRMPSVDEYLQYAEQCLALAAKSSHAAAKARLLQMAQASRDLPEKRDNGNSSKSREPG